MPVTVIHQAAGLTTLEDWGTVGTPMSEPPCKIRGLRQDINGVRPDVAGFWECSPGSFRRNVTDGEVMHILQGEGTFTPDGGNATAFQSGDTLFFPPMTNGLWDIRKTVRKLYVLLSAD